MHKKTWIGMLALSMTLTALFGLTACDFGTGGSGGGDDGQTIQTPNGGQDKPDDSGNKNPSGGEDKPSGGDDKPSGGDDKPSGGDDKPSGGDDKPSGGDDKPGGGDDNPGGTTEPEITPPEEKELTLSNLKYKWSDTYKGYEVVGFAENKTEQTSLSIPDSVNEYPVTRIGNRAFYNCSELTDISIPDSVTSIGEDAFLGTAFYEVESNWENEVLYLGKYLIGAKVTISGDYQIKADTKVIGDWAFDSCKELTSVTIPDNVINIGDYAFLLCSGLTNVTIGNSVLRIGEKAFSGASGLTNISVAEGNQKFYSIENCIIERARKMLVLGCKTSVIPSDGSVTSIGDSAFSGASGLTSIVIPDSVTYFDKYAFGASGLTSIIIPDSVTSIGEGVFSHCRELKEVYYKGTSADWDKISINNYFSGNSILTSATRYYYVENEADVPTDGGKYWHYVDGTPTAW